ncbi:prolipoprotein diacylglyceryl transferase [Taibaiella soli]|uniref:Diacylglyceryl transferase n=1 Tax=Taibaiella soli TaxID=1649169 RepID=A0A2W2BYU2_9BACT|nr:prolipoprotein diacylglyceryl transferase family protein [Taibaiella soli]PZF73053.1 diacylglyceryl transferase [Taibaiella soli]
MVFPYSVHIGQQIIRLHGVFEFLGIFIAFRYYLFLRRRKGDTINTENRLFIVIGATFGAVIGSHLLGALENIPEWMAATSKWQYLYGNKTLVGGVLGGLFGVESVKLLVGEKQRSGDLFVFPLLLGMIIGRVGCFSAGIYEETYGLPSKLPWAMDLGDGILRHPVALYEIVFLILLWTSLSVLNKKEKLDSGALFKLFMIGYLLFRFLLDFIKPGWRYCLGLGSIQLACLAGLIYYGRYLLRPALLLKKKELSYAG